MVGLLDRKWICVSLFLSDWDVEGNNKVIISVDKIESLFSFIYLSSICDGELKTLYLFSGSRNKFLSIFSIFYRNLLLVPKLKA